MLAKMLTIKVAVEPRQEQTLVRIPLGWVSPRNQGLDDIKLLRPLPTFGGPRVKGRLFGLLFTRAGGADLGDFRLCC